MGEEGEEAAQVARRTSRGAPAGQPADRAPAGSAGEAPSQALPVVFRVSPEPFRYHTEAEVHAALTADPAGYLAFLRRALEAIASGEARLTLPAKQVFPDAQTNGDFRVMPCETGHAGATTKSVKLIGTNTVQQTVPDQITVGRLFVLDARENYVSDIYEACLLSSARTGACAALAISVLARRRRELVVVGSGRVGLYTALYAAALGGIARVRFCDEQAQRAEQAAQWVSSHAAILAQPASLSGIGTADVVVLATTSTHAIARPPGWHADLLVSLGADTDTQSELDPAWAGHAEIYCDTRDSVRFGDLKAWCRSGIADPAGIPDLLAILREPPPDSGRQRVFVSTGSALFDNLTARYLLERTPIR